MSTFHDRSNANKGYIIKEEDKHIIAEQTKLGAVMDLRTKKEIFLREHKEKFNKDDSLLLYRLPLNETQLENMYFNLIQEKL